MRTSYRFLLVVLLCAAVALAPRSAAAQLVRQSDLTFEDVDPSFELTLDHLAMDSRWLGLPPRDVTWSPDGAWIYFRWREEPEAGQEWALDPWFAVNRAGTEVRRVSDEEAARIPTGGIVWSADRRAAAWSRGGTLFLWTADEGTRPIWSSGSGLGDVRISTDGSRVTFTAGGGEQGANLWRYDISEGSLRQLTEIVSPSKDYEEGEEWLRNQQLRLLEVIRDRKREEERSDSLRRTRPPVGPQPIPLEEGAEARGIQFSPDGRYVTFEWVKEPSEDNRTYYMSYVNRSGQAEPERSRPKVGAPMPEYRMGIVRIDRTVPVDSIDVVWVDDGTEKETIIHGPYWNPQGTVALVQILSMDHEDRWIARLDLETGETTVIHHEHQNDWIGGPLVGGRWSPGWLEWRPGGRRFGFVSEKTGWAMLYLGSVNGGVTQLTSGEWEVRDARLSPDGDTWFLVTSKQHPGAEHLYHLPATGGELTQITVGEGVYDPVISPDGERIAFTFETPLIIPDLYLMDNEAGAEERQITKSGTNAYYRYDWAESEIISFPSPKGKETWAEVWELPEQQNGAAVLHVHGCGPCAQAVDKSWGGGAALYANYMRQKGYTMASLDYRGSWGYGHENRTAVFESMGHEDVDSSLPLLDILAERYGVDRDRIGLYGCSYGGFYTLMALLRHPGAYAAGVAMCSVADWAHYNRGYTSRILNGRPYENPEAYRRSSPIYYAENLADPLQIQHGLVDGNVQIQSIFRLTQRFIELDKNFDLVIYPVEGHGWGRYSSEYDSYQRMTRFFDRYLLDQANLDQANASGGNAQQ